MITNNIDYTVHGREAEATRPLPKSSLGKIVHESLKNDSTKIAIEDAHTGATITYADLRVKVEGLAVALTNLGYGPDDIIAISSENHINYFIPMLSAFYLAMPVTPLNQNYTPQELHHTVSISKPSLIFCSKQVCLKFKRLREDCKFIKKIILIDSDESFEGEECLDDFISNNQLQITDKKNVILARVDVDEHVAFIMCSSGTTGLPKGVMLTHTNIITRLEHAKDHRYHVFDGSTVNLGFLPLFHVFGLMACLGSIVLRCRLVIMKRFEVHEFLGAVQAYRATTLWMVPSIVVLIAKSDVVSQYDLSSIREIFYGAAPLSKENEAAFTERFDSVILRQVYGATETTYAVTCLSLFDKSKIGTSGRLYPYMRCIVRDPETGRSLGPNQAGELCFKGALVMKGYYGNPKATEEAFTEDGWLRTGDVAYYDEDEYIFIIDRMKELIKYKGFQVAPAELEGVLLMNPKIRDAGVVGLPDESAGELPLAFVVKQPGVSLTEEEVKDCIEKTLSHHKWLRGGVVFVDEIPRNPSGKVLRREMRAMLREMCVGPNNNKEKKESYF